LYVLDEPTTGLHFHDSENGSWNTTYVSKTCFAANAVLIRWATRQRGLVVRKDSAIKRLEDVAGHRIAFRQPNSGTAVLWDQLMGSTNTSQIYLSEQDAVVAVAEKAVDVTFGLRAVADQFNLGFVPVMDEQFDLLVERTAYFEPAIQRFLQFCQSDDFRNRAKDMKGYDLTRLGAKAGSFVGFRVFERQTAISMPSSSSSSTFSAIVSV
jgi:molybdate-binding protein